ncbi:MAG TPA: FlgD immunoglobulin-like domain containing protein, partial [bacterium]|nr:FlgD immunoglobulin-like domain containing protein [bacterium]
TYYYRLRQVDRDGAATYSAVVTAIVKAPALFELNQNFPNPFHGMTRFSYLLPQDSWIEIQVCDLTGREVALLKRGMSGMGERTLQWDGRDAKGSRVSDGLYLLKMSDGRRTAVRRMVLLN